MTFRTVVKEVALEQGVFASFMPKPLADQPGSGMHTHLSLFEGDRNAFHEAGGHLELSKTARRSSPACCAHAAEITAVTNQFVNSYKRLWGGAEAPSYVCWGHNNRSALVRVPHVQARQGQLEPHRVPRGRLRHQPVPRVRACCSPPASRASRRATSCPRAPRTTSGSSPTPSAARWASSRCRPRSTQAIAIMEKSELVAETLGEHVFDFFLRNKRAGVGRVPRAGHAVRAAAVPAGPVRPVTHRRRPPGGSTLAGRLDARRRVADAGARRAAAAPTRRCVDARRATPTPDAAPRRRSAEVADPDQALLALAKLAGAVVRRPGRCSALLRGVLARATGPRATRLLAVRRARPSRSATPRGAPGEPARARSTTTPGTGVPVARGARRAARRRRRRPRRATCPWPRSPGAAGVDAMRRAYRAPAAADRRDRPRPRRPADPAARRRRGARRPRRRRAGGGARARPRRASTTTARRAARRHRHGQGRRARAQLRQRRRRHLRRRAGRRASTRPRRSRSAPGSPPASRGRARRRRASRRCGRSTPRCGPRARTGRWCAPSPATAPTTSAGPRRGSSRRCSRRGRSPATRRSGAAYVEAIAAVRVGGGERENFVEDSQAMRRRVEEHVPAGGGRPAAQARRRRAARRRVHGPAAPARARAGRRVDPQPEHADRARGAGRRRVRRPRRTPPSSRSATGCCACSSTASSCTGCAAPT